MTSSISRVLGLLVLGDACLALLIFGFGLLLRAVRIPMAGHPILTVLFGSHGLLFGLVLPVLIYLLVPLAIAWAIAALVGFLKG